jgi:hypothetical protein
MKSKEKVIKEVHGLLSWCLVEKKRFEDGQRQQDRGILVN